jgi:hypothetical protein
MMLLTSFLVFSGCSLKLPNVEFCGKRIDGGRCKYILDNRARDISEEEWNMPGRVSMSLHDFGELKKYMIEACARVKSCKITTEQELQAERFINEQEYYSD